MWDQSPLTSAVQAEALRLLSEWWDASRPTRARWGRRRAATATGATVADVLVLPAGYQPAHLDERLAEVTRLTALGASPERPLGHGAWVLQEPAGNRFCGIYPETPNWPHGTKQVTGPTTTGP
jgi:Glyoxalase-like domain